MCSARRSSKDAAPLSTFLSISFAEDGVFDLLREEVGVDTPEDGGVTSLTLGRIEEGSEEEDEEEEEEEDHRDIIGKGNSQTKITNCGAASTLG